VTERGLGARGSEAKDVYGPLRSDSEQEQGSVVEKLEHSL
jgi:hypothetical protein